MRIEKAPNHKHGACTAVMFSVRSFSADERLTPITTPHIIPQEVCI
jgi:hypothetical protein